MKIGLGSSEGGKHLKEKIKEYLRGKGYEITDYTNEKNEYLESLEIANIIKETSLNKNES